MARSTGRRATGAVLFILSVAAVLAFVFLLFSEANSVDVAGVGSIPTMAVVVAAALAIVALLLLILMVTGRWDQQEETAGAAEAFFIPQDAMEAQDAARAETFDAAFAKEAPRPAPAPRAPAAIWAAQGADAIDVGGGLVVYDLGGIPVDTRAWGTTATTADGRVHSFHFPRSVERGVYVNDYIQIADGAERLKLRTLLAGPREIGAPAPARPARPAATPARGTVAPPPAPLMERPASVWDIPPKARAPSAARELPGDRFMRDLESRFTQPAPVTTAEETDVFYDYPGDIHNVSEVEGIGPVNAEKLRQLGIKTTARLCYEDAASLAERLDVPFKRVEQWQAMAELMKINGVGPQYAEALARAGISGIQELKRRSARAVADQVNDYLAKLETNVLGTAVTEKRVESWQTASKQMRRVRQRIPEL